MSKLSLRRHRDDERFDQVTIHRHGISIVEITVHPRFKTSGLSGDEWRFHVCTKFFDHNGECFQEDNCLNIKTALDFLPFFGWKYRDQLDIYSGVAHLEVYQKNNLVWKTILSDVGEAIFGAPRMIILAGESSPEWNCKIPDESYCQQIGCIKAPCKILRYKKKQLAQNERMMCDFEYNWEPRHIWFCEEHSERGDASLEDCDENYETIETST